MTNKKSKNTLTEQEKKEWEELCSYVHTKVMDYDENQKLNKNMILRLKGLSSGKYIANNSIKDQAKYPYKVILMTFKACIPTIQNTKRTMRFEDSQHKLNYFIKIIEGKIDEIYERYKLSQKQVVEIENIDTRVIEHESAEFNEKQRVNKLVEDLDELW